MSRSARSHCMSASPLSSGTDSSAVRHSHVAAAALTCACACCLRLPQTSLLAVDQWGKLNTCMVLGRELHMLGTQNYTPAFEKDAPAGLTQQVAGSGLSYVWLCAASGWAPACTTISNLHTEPSWSDCAVSVSGLVQCVMTNNTVCVQTG
jgi:hypothetical protein